MTPMYVHIMKVLLYFILTDANIPLVIRRSLVLCFSFVFCFFTRFLYQRFQWDKPGPAIWDFTVLKSGIVKHELCELKIKILFVYGFTVSTIGGDYLRLVTFMVVISFRNSQERIVSGAAVAVCVSIKVVVVGVEWRSAGMDGLNIGLISLPALRAHTHTNKQTRAHTSSAHLPILITLCTVQEFVVYNLAGKMFVSLL